MIVNCWQMNSATPFSAQENCLTNGMLCKKVLYPKDGQYNQRIHQKFSALMNEICVMPYVFYRFLLQNSGREDCFSAAVHYGFITVGKPIADQSRKQGHKQDAPAFKNIAKPRYNNKKAPIFRLVLCGGDEGDRTPYLLNAIQALSQVSYTPTAI